MNKKHQQISRNQTSTIRLFKKYLTSELAIIIAGVILYYLFINITNHAKYQSIMPSFIIVFALLKVIYFLNHTFRRIPTEKPYTFYKLLYSFGFIIFVIILSFAVDYTCLSDCKAESFSGINNDFGFIHKFLEFLYFSVVTFATIGYGDIIPVTLSSKVLVVLEISFSFIMVVFIISNFKNIKYNFN